MGEEGVRTGITQPWIIHSRSGERTHIRISVDERHNRSYPIDRDHDLPRFQSNGRSLTDQRQMRQGLVKRVKQHLHELHARYPGEETRAFVGNGNLLANFGFVGWVRGILYHLADEPVFENPYTCMVSWKDALVTIEDLWFAYENGMTDVMRKIDGTVQDITNQIEFATSGQPLVRENVVIPLEQIAEKWYDTRHLVQPICIAINGKTLFIPNAQLQQGLIRKAICQPVHIRPVAQVDEGTTLPLTTEGWLHMSREHPSAVNQAACFLKEQGILMDDEDPMSADVLLKMAEIMKCALEKALQDAGYDLVDYSRPLNEGEVRFINGHIEIFFRKALYPHNIFVRWQDNSFGFVIFPGKSGLAGTTLSYAQYFLTEELKVRDAVLLDNGGDVRLYYRSNYLVPSSEKREEIRSILALTVSDAKWCGDSIRVF